VVPQAAPVFLDLMHGDNGRPYRAAASQGAKLIAFPNLNSRIIVAYRLDLPAWAIGRAACRRYFDNSLS